ncbi:MAG: DNA polymerase III subunit delta [Verrucomicrobia bacterium]|nr:DNA polymerase III subunit delta [Verrucomicrobiota bacterium]
MTYLQIINELNSRKFKPIYFLFGEEEYFIDQISDYIENNALNAAEKEFNQSILYGIEIDPLSLEAEARRYPMMAEYNVVIVKEAQNLKQFEKLLNYVNNPSPSTILVLNYKHKKPNGRQAITKALKKNAVFFESKRLYENQVYEWLSTEVKRNGFTIEPKATAMLVESIGIDLSKLSNELSKLFISLEKGTTIQANSIEENIGISKDYNVFELNKALATKDVLKANTIAQHFGRNPKEYALPKILPMIYRYFSQLLIYHQYKGQPPKVLATKMGVNPYFLKDFEKAAYNYNIKKIAQNISHLRRADAHSKGIGASNLAVTEIYKELIFGILH